MRKSQASADIAYITPDVLVWARKRSGLSASEVATRVKVDIAQLAGWETGKSSPPFSTAQSLSKTLKVPFGYLFLPETPQETIPLPDFRAAKVKARTNPDFMELLNDVLSKQDWFREYAIEAGEKPRRFVGSFTIKEEVAKVATSIQQMLHLDPALRRSASSWSDYLTLISRNAEEAGILVMRSGVVGNASRRKLSKQDVQGFAISDPIAPLIFINADDFKTAQIFTLAHELAHIWVGQTAISNPDEASAGTDVLESFCNRVAVEVLVPSSEFTALWSPQVARPKLIGRLARHFWVSTIVIIRRAHELGMIDSAEFSTLLVSERTKIAKRPAGGGSYYRNVVARMGSRLTYAVLGEVNQSRILFRDAARLLGMKVPTLVKFASMNR